jgi:hypothetical protein
MADTRQRTTWGARFRFLVRAVGLTGVLAVAAGATLAATAFPESAEWTSETLRAATEGAHGQFAKVALITLVAGLAAVGAALVVELLGSLFMVTGRRTVASATTSLATIAAIALLVFVNAYSFTHHSRFDFTRNRQFTLPPELADRLRTLRSDRPTTIVVLQKHRIFGTLSDERDAFTKAAEEKVTEKVKDLVDLFRELGPRFNVSVLDTEAFGYSRQLAELARDAPELKEAIEAAPENSVLFHANKRVQRLAFNEFLQLDKTASRAADGGRGNLVLLPQGVENFARRILAVQERRPKVAVCVVHELLTTAYPEGRGRMFTMAGLKKALAENGYDVIDVVLKKNWGSARSIDDLKPAADTREESMVERLEGALAAASDETASAREQSELLGEIRKRIDAVKGRPWPERQALYQRLIRGTVTEEFEPRLLATLAKQQEESIQLLADARKAQQAAESKLKAALLDERTGEGRRLTDVKSKLARILADVDLIVVPRFTVEDAADDDGGPDVAPALHGLSKEHIEALRDFMLAGKPILACVGPISGRSGPAPDGPDAFERLLAERGIELGRETILFDGEAAAFAALRAGEQFGGGAPTDIPPLVLVDAPGERLQLNPNPIAAATVLTARSVDQKLDLKAKALRPVYLSPTAPVNPSFVAEFVTTGPEAWNEERPFPQTRLLPDGTFAATDIPRYNPTPLDDPKKGTPLEERRGPFPIGVAVEGLPPAHWTESRLAPDRVAALMTAGPGLAHLIAALAANAASNSPKGERSRLVVFGSGNLFSGPKLDPAREKLLLHSANWLTGREDRLPRAELPSWSFPRVAMTDREQTLWRLGTAIGLPLAAVYLGLMVTLVRRLR